MEGRRKAVLTAEHTGYLCIPVSFVLDGGHIAQTAGGIFSNPSFFPSRIVFDSYILKMNMGSACSHIFKNSVVVSFGATASPWF